MQPNPLFDFAVSIIQKGLIALGAYLVGQGLTNQNGATAIVGLAPVIVGAGWGLWTRWQAHKVAVAAANAGVDLRAVKADPVQAKP